MKESVGIRLALASCSLFFLLSCGGGGGSTSDAVDPPPANSAPTDIALSNASVDENAIAAEIGSLQTTDANAGDTFTYTLSGSDGSDFSISGNTLALGDSISANFEAQSLYELTVTTRDSAGATFSKDFQIDVIDQNDAPALEVVASLEVLENLEGPLISFAASDEDDPEGFQAIYGLLGDDAELFSLAELPYCAGPVCPEVIEPGKALIFKDSPNFESPQDSGFDNLYELQLSVSDGTESVTSDLAITVTDAVEGRVVDAPLKNADVCLDLDSDSQCSEEEEVYQSDEQGFYNLPNREAAPGIKPQIISIGGVDIVTGKNLENLALMAKVPADPAKNVTVTPLSTLLSIAEDPDLLLRALGVDEGITADDLIDLDPWWLGTETEAQAKDEISADLGLTAEALDSVIEKSVTLSVQIATLVQAADTAIPATSAGGVQSVQDRALMVTASVVKQVESAWVDMVEAGGSPSLSNPELIETILVETVVDTAAEIATWIETRIESGEIDESSLDADTLSAVIDLKNQSEVIAQTGLSGDTLTQVTAVASTTTAVNEQIEAAIQNGGVEVLADMASAEALSDLVDETLEEAADLIAGAIDVEEYLENTNVSEIVEQSGGLLDIVDVFVDTGATSGGTTDGTSDGSGTTSGGTTDGSSDGSGTTSGGTTDGTSDGSGTTSGGTTDGTSDGSGTTSGGTTDGTSDGSGTTSGGTTDGSSDGTGTTSGGTTDGTSDGSGSTSGGTTDGSSDGTGTTSGGTTDGTSDGSGTTSGGTTDGSSDGTGTTSGGTTDGTSDGSGSTSGGTTDGSSDGTGTTSGGTTDGTSDGSGSTSGGTTNGTSDGSGTTSGGTTDGSSDSSGSTSGGSGSAAPTNNTPVISSDSTFSVAENQMLVGTVTATDVEGDAFTYQLTGTNAEAFSITSAGVLSFVTAPNYEEKSSYAVTVTVSDASGSSSQSLVITVTNVNETPSITSAANVSVNENSAAVLSITSTDPDGDVLAYSLSGSDSGLFDVDASSSVISFKATPDFETPSDVDGDNIYLITVTGSDGNGASVSQDLVITVTDVNETVTGVLIDGYLAGATVFQDLNNNGAPDSGEPQTTTDILGNFTLTLQSASPDARVRVVNTGFDIGANDVLGAMLDISPRTSGKYIMTPLSTLAARMMSFDEGMTKAVAEQVVADAVGVDLADAPNGSLFGYDPIKKLTDSDSGVAAKAQNVYAANQQLMALGNVAGGSATYIGQQALSAAQSSIQTILDNNGLSATASLSVSDSSILAAEGHSGYLDGIAEHLTLHKPAVDAFRLEPGAVELIDYVNGQVANTHQLYPSVSGSTLSSSLSGGKLDLSNFYQLLSAESGATSPTIKFGLNSIPAAGSLGTATVTLTIFDGTDGVRSGSEKRISATMNVNWASDGADVTITAPTQQVAVTLVTASAALSSEFTNNDPDVLTFNQNGPVKPSSLELRIGSFVPKNIPILGTSPENYFTAGDYFLELSFSGIDMRAADDTTFTKVEAGFTLIDDPTALFVCGRCHRK